MNHKFKCIDIWHGESLGAGDSSLFIGSIWAQKCLGLKGT